MHPRTITGGELRTAFAIGGQEDFGACAAGFETYPDLFAGLFDGPRMVGAAYGWPVRPEREDRPLMRLEVIAVVPEHQGKGHGRRLLEFWEGQVARRGSWTVDLGSAADGFYLKCGYTPVEYCLKVHRDDLPPDFRERGYAVSFVSRAEDSLVALYVRTGGAYHPEVMDDLRRTFNAREGLFIFRKTIPGRA